RRAVSRADGRGAAETSGIRHALTRRAAEGDDRARAHDAALSRAARRAVRGHGPRRARKFSREPGKARQKHKSAGARLRDAPHRRDPADVQKYFNLEERPRPRGREDRRAAAERDAQEIIRRRFRPRKEEAALLADPSITILPEYF